MNDMILEWIGYVASAIVLVSLLMSSIKKLRWINLVGALLFGAYGFMIGSIPTGLMNVGIVIIDVYYLARIYLSKDYFKILPVSHDSDYTRTFLSFYESDINTFGDLEKANLENAEISLYILRNMNPAGLFICDKYDNDTLEIKLDYAIPQYRDFKMGDFLFEKNRDYFINLGYKKFIAFTDEKAHINYVKKMGFKEINLDSKIGYIKEI